MKFNKVDKATLEKAKEILEKAEDKRISKCKCKSSKLQ